MADDTQLSDNDIPMPAFGNRRGLAQDSVQQPPPAQQPPPPPATVPPNRRDTFVQNFIDEEGRKKGHKIALKMQAQNFSMFKKAKDKKQWFEDHSPSWFDGLRQGMFSDYKLMRHDRIYNSWTALETYVKKNYVNQAHSAGADYEGETVPAEFRILYNYFLAKKNKKNANAWENVVVESSTIASIPLGPDTSAARRSHRHRDNVRNGVAQPHVANRNNGRAVGAEGTETMRIARIHRGDSLVS